VGSDPVEPGIVPSLGRPGGNVTGVASLTADLTAKRLELLRELLPNGSRVAVLRTPGDFHHAFSASPLTYPSSSRPHSSS
jgi:putative ABC transport system substrate-binding protein